MSLTEDEARTKWCPMVRHSGDGANMPERDAECVGAACMMWRWHEPWTSSVEEGQGGDLVLRLSRKPDEPKRGYCGLAGKPEP